MAPSSNRLAAMLEVSTRRTAAGSIGGYVAAVVLVGAALLLRGILQPWLGQNVPYLQFFPAILLAAWYGGFGPGAAATALSAAAATQLYLPPAGVTLRRASDAVSLALFAATGLAIAALNGRVRKAEQARRAEAERSIARARRLDAIINTSVDGIVVINATGIVEEFNPGAERLFGYPAAEVLGRNVSLLMPSPHREEHDGYLARYLATGRAKIIGIGREVAGRRKDGTTFPLHLSVSELTLGGERKFTGILHDLSERVRMEQQIREQTALASLGEMAAVIAHEVKNPLAGIRGAMQVFASRMAGDTAESRIVGEIITRIDALDRMIQELLLFARPPHLNMMPLDMAQLVASTARLLSRDPLLQQIDVDVAGSAPPVSGDADLLQIVFQNLLLNAAHAIQGRGRVQISVAASGSTCEIAVRDGGPGIPADIRDQVFTPFFTTKARGTGLGLPTAKRIVEAHDGRISVESPPGGGTIVLVSLPTAVADSSR